MNCKKALMGFAALLILLFHFYIPFGSEGNIFAAAYFGVDIFFFVSAYSLGKKDKILFSSFIPNRLLNIYFPFVILSLINFFYSKWKIKKLIFVLTGIDFFQKSGGAFLWYLIAIMMLYFLVPYFSLIKSKLGLKSFGILILSWAVIAVILQFGFNYTKVFILLNRLPIFFIGFFYDELKNLLNFENWKINNKIKRIVKILISLFLITLGLFLTIKFGSKIKLNKPIKEFYYILAIPIVIGFAELFEILFANYKPKILNFIGQLTLEIYGLQMIFGYTIESMLLKLMKNASSFKEFQIVVSFLGTVSCIILMAFLFNWVLKILKSIPKKINQKRG